MKSVGPHNTQEVKVVKDLIILLRFFFVQFAECTYNIKCYTHIKRIADLKSESKYIFRGEAIADRIYRLFERRKK